jgi:hypothetical protein
VSSRLRAKLGEARDGVIVDGLERIKEACCLLLGERDPALIGKDVSCATGSGAPEEVAQRFADCGGGGLVGRSLFVGESQFKSLGPHYLQCTDAVRAVQVAVGCALLSSSDGCSDQPLKLIRRLEGLVRACGDHQAAITTGVPAVGDRQRDRIRRVADRPGRLLRGGVAVVFWAVFQ